MELESSGATSTSVFLNKFRRVPATISPLVIRSPLAWRRPIEIHLQARPDRSALQGFQRNRHYWQKRLCRGLVVCSLCLDESILQACSRRDRQPWPVRGYNNFRVMPQEQSSRQCSNAADSLSWLGLELTFSPCQILSFETTGEFLTTLQPPYCLHVRHGQCLHSGRAKMRSLRMAGAP